MQLPGLSLRHLCALRHPQDNVRRSETSGIFRNLGVFIVFRRVIDAPQIGGFAYLINTNSMISARTLSTPHLLSCFLPVQLPSNHVAVLGPWSAMASESIEAKSGPWVLISREDGPLAPLAAKQPWARLPASVFLQQGSCWGQVVPPRFSGATSKILWVPQCRGPYVANTGGWSLPVFPLTLF